MLVPELSARYELLGELATGGMATVYLGRQSLGGGLWRLVAVKSLLPELAEDESFLAMFLDEATLTAKIKHPNVVPTLDVVAAESRLLIVMEYVEGLSLAKILELASSEKAPIPAAIAVTIVSDLLRGLHAAHELVDASGRPLRVVHRDISPENVIIGVDGVARLLDFGIAKAASQRHVTAQGEIKGKLAYMPIEQQLGEGVDRRSDVYSTGVVLWEMLAGRRLYTEVDEEALVRRVFEGRVDPPSGFAAVAFPTELDRVVLRALARTREDRWWSAEEMAKALTRAVPPAAYAEVARLLHKLGGGELELRARHVRELETLHPKLPSEAQLVLDVLTSERRRPNAVVRDESQRVPSPTKPDAPLVQEVAANEEARARRRAARKAKRRREQILILGGMGVVIFVAMVVALAIGSGFSFKR